MAKMRGVDVFSKLWKRRVTLETEDGTRYELMSLPDLVRARKTQRDKDWPMIRRLVEADYFKHQGRANQQHLRFWFLESRTPEMLADLASAHPALCRNLIKPRPLLRFARSGDKTALADALAREEEIEREADRRYWAPLKKELEQLRRARLRTQ